MDTEVKEFEFLKGRTLTRITRHSSEKNELGDFIEFTADNGDVFRMWHEQDCCEDVYIDDVAGNLDDLLESPIVMAESVSSSEDPGKPCDESYTWTFYKVATTKGYVTIRWYGSSNGYYSERVTFRRVNP